MRGLRKLESITQLVFLANLNLAEVRSHYLF